MATFGNDDIKLLTKPGGQAGQTIARPARPALAAHGGAELRRADDAGSALLPARRERLSAHAGAPRSLCRRPARRADARAVADRGARRGDPLRDHARGAARLLRFRCRRDVGPERRDYAATAFLRMRSSA